MAASIVERATSDMLIAPDWAMNLEICDIVNADPGQTKEVIKAVKKRIGTKNPKIQILALTLLEALMQNCGDSVHQQVAEKDVLLEMVKIVKKKPDLNVKEKILVLLDTWQEAFGGSRARYQQYFNAYNDLLRTGIEFPPRPEGVAPLFTPPQTQPTTTYPPQNYGSAGFGDGLDPAVLTDTHHLSLIEIENARGSADLLSEMLSALDPCSKEGISQEVITELVERCRSSQQQIMSLLNTTQDEDILGKGLTLNDDLQSVLAKYDAIVSGQAVTWPTRPTTTNSTIADEQEEDEAEDDLVQLSRRSSRVPAHSQEKSSEVNFGKQSSLFPLIPPPPGLKKMNVASGKVDQRDFLSGDIYDSPTGDQQNVGSEKGNLHSTYPSSDVVQQIGEVNTADIPAASSRNPNSYQENMFHAKDSHPESYTQTSPHLPPPWELPSSGNAQMTDSQQGSHLYESNDRTLIPPPPSKHNQRQQFFQQHASGSAQYMHGIENDDDDLARMTQNLSLHGAVNNEYGSVNSQQPLTPAKNVKPEDNLFGDLVDFAKLKKNLPNKS